MNKWEKAEDRNYAPGHVFNVTELPPGGALRVCILEAADLPRMDWPPFKDARPDPYLRISVYNLDGDEDDCHSRQIRNAKSPVFSFCCSLALPRPMDLEITVFDHDYVTKDQVIGTCSLPPVVTDAAWCKLISHPDVAARGGDSARLKLSITLTGNEALDHLPPALGDVASPAPPPLYPPRQPWVAPFFNSPTAYSVSVGLTVAAAVACCVGYILRRRCTRGSRQRRIGVELAWHAARPAASSQLSDDAKLFTTEPI
uniref:C2 domain-containing protein n=1 Tax=Coccolithus braarudii TaxID=221442 RepID=A0A7S0PZ23_9EUKA|mmetsp:Transcript_24279/g.52399  ORF Transcript_24279/g.52399 Transcript_24279/m.52399 type:complete len:257 (+) Transcript_24279:179-949(+)